MDKYALTTYYEEYRQSRGRGWDAGEADAKNNIPTQYHVDRDYGAYAEGYIDGYNYWIKKNEQNHRNN